MRWTVLSTDAGQVYAACHALCQPIPAAHTVKDHTTKGQTITVKDHTIKCYTIAGSRMLCQLEQGAIRGERCLLATYFQRHMLTERTPARLFKGMGNVGQPYEWMPVETVPCNNAVGKTLE